MNGKVTVKKEKGSIYRQDGEKFWPQDSGLTVMGLIPRLHVAHESLCSYHACRPLRARFKEGDHCVAQFSR